MTFANRTPPGQSPFIAGPYPGLGTTYGEYIGIATVNLPGYARDISIARRHSSVVASGPEGPTLLEGATSTSSRGRPRASPSTSCCPSPTAP